MKKYKQTNISIELPEKEIKLATNTTSKDHFKNWKSAPAQPILEYPVFAGSLMYPSDKRRMLTTNTELFFKNYGIYRAPTSAINIFENQFKVNQGRKMDLNTIYHHDYKRINLKLARENTEIIRPDRRHLAKEKSSVELRARIPMHTTTQSMADYKFDPDSYMNTASQYQDMFKSNLNKGLKPLEDVTYDRNYKVSTLAAGAGAAIPAASGDSDTELNNSSSNLFGQSHLTSKTIVSRLSPLLFLYFLMSLLIHCETNVALLEHIRQSAGAFAQSGAISAESKRQSNSNNRVV